MKAVRYFLTILITFTLFGKADGSQPQRPAELDTLNYTQVLFQWAPVMGTEGYHLQVAVAEEYDAFEVALVFEGDSPTNATIVSTGIDWGNEYVWRYWIVDGDGNNGDTSRVHRFSIMAFPENVPVYDLTITNRDEVQPGITILDTQTDYAAAFDIDGNYKMFLPGGGDYQILPDGDFLSLERGFALRTNLDGDTTYYSPHGGMHHEVDLLPNGNYLALGRSYRWVPTPEIEGDTIQTDSLLWEGDFVFEFNPAGDTLWSWDCHDHVSYLDFEPDEILDVPEGGEFDWTHGNTCHYLPEMNAVYISLRHISRIVLIDYETGDVIWNMGKEFPSGEVDFGHDLNFSYQHDPEWQPNGNILMFDNHNLGPEEFSRAVEISIDLERDPVAEIVWESWCPTYAPAQGDADRLPNGNTLITPGRNGYTYEVNADGEELWKLERNPVEGFRGNKIYRADRIPNLYPLVYTIDGPSNGDHIPDGDSYFHLTLNNLGHCEQSYHYVVTDEEGWFDVQDGWVQLAAGESSTMTIRGETPEGTADNTVTVEVFPARRRGLVDTWTVTLTTDPEMSTDPKVTNPVTWSLLNNHPNPFNAGTSIAFSVSSPGQNRLNIFDTQGRLVKTLLNQSLFSGRYEISWDGTDHYGRLLSAGVYICRLQNSSNSVVKSMTLLR